MVLSDQIIIPQIYLEAITGEYYPRVNDGNVVANIKKLLAEYDSQLDLRDWALQDINQVVESNVDVVLVDVSTIIGERYVYKYHWFEVPKNLKYPENLT